MAFALIHESSLPRSGRLDSPADVYPPLYETSFQQPKSRHPTSAELWGRSSPSPPRLRGKVPSKLQQVPYDDEPRTLPEIDDEDSMYPPHRSHAKEIRHSSRVQPSRHGQRTDLGSPINLRSPSSVVTTKTPDEDSHATFHRVDNPEAHATCKVERKSEYIRKERRSPKETQRSPSNARSDDVWGSSMYDVDVDERRF